MNQETYISQKAILKGQAAYLNTSFFIIFSILWLFDCFLTVWATNNGYVEVWNSWTKLITDNSYIFILVKLVTLSIVLLMVKWANATFPYVISIALLLSNVLVGTVSAANIITIINT